jgi:hypothetical protein
VDPVEAAVEAVRRQGIRIDRPVVVRDATNVLVHFPPAPVVARVPITLARLRGPEWSRQVVELSGFLADAGAPVAPPSDDVDPGPHAVGGFQVSLWRWIDHDRERLDAPAAGRALRDVHLALASYAGGLPSADRLDEVIRLLRTLPPSEELDELAGLAGRLAPLDGPPIHGDAHLGNVLWSPEGPLWSDLENACRGPVAFDLACLRFRPSAESEAAIEAYGSDDAAAVDGVMPHLTLFLAAWTQVVAERMGLPAATAEARRRLDRALAYAREM